MDIYKVLEDDFGNVYTHKVRGTEKYAGRDEDELFIYDWFTTKDDIYFFVEKPEFEDFELNLILVVYPHKDYFQFGLITVSPETYSEESIQVYVENRPENFFINLGSLLA